MATLNWNLLQTLIDSIQEACSRNCIKAELCSKLERMQKTMETLPPPSGLPQHIVNLVASSLAEALAEEAMAMGCSNSSKTFYTLSQQLRGGGVVQSLRLPSKRL